MNKKEIIFTKKQIEGIQEVQKNYKCKWEDAFEMWREDTSYMENGE